MTLKERVDMLISRTQLIMFLAVGRQSVRSKLKSGPVQNKLLDPWYYMWMQLNGIGK